MRVLVCGGRDFEDPDFVARVMDHIDANFCVEAVIHGAARGADSLGADWALAREIPSTAFPADWEAHGKAAGPIRNQRMLDEGRPHMVIAFPGGKGTADMFKRAVKAGLPAVAFKNPWLTRK